jgi:hypothetical protein
MNYPTGKAHLLMLIADPVAHVRAAQVVNSIFEKKKLDAFLIPIHVPAADLTDIVPRLLSSATSKVATGSSSPSCRRTAQDMCPAPIRCTVKSWMYFTARRGSQKLRRACSIVLLLNCARSSVTAHNTS